MFWPAQLGHVGRGKQVKTCGPSIDRITCGLLSLLPEGKEMLQLCLMETVIIQFNSVHTEIKLYN